MWSQRDCRHCCTDHDTVAWPILQAVLPLMLSQRSEVQICHLAQEKATLEVQLEEVTQLLRSEREAAHGREQELLEKIAEANSQIADLTSTNTGTCLYHSSFFVLSVQKLYPPSPPQHTRTPHSAGQ